MQLVLCAWVKLQEEDGDDDELRGLDLTKYRSVVARANFVAQDRPDIRYSVKELCRDMSRPVQSNTQRFEETGEVFVGTSKGCLEDQAQASGR